MSKKGKSFIFERNGEVKWCAGGLFTNRWERRMAEYFPLFGSPCHDLDALTHIVNKYHLDAITLDCLDLSVRTSNCLRKENIETFDVILMMYPYQIRQVKNWGGGGNLSGKFRKQLKISLALRSINKVELRYWKYLRARI